MSIADLIARLEALDKAERDPSFTADALSVRNDARADVFPELPRLLRLLRAGEKAVECLFVPCVECGGRGAFSDADDLAEMCQRCSGAGRYPMDDDCAAALREWDEAAR